VPARLVDKRTRTEFTLAKGVNSIGRHNDNDIQLPGPRMSRYHAEIIFEDGAWYVEDQGSTYGTFLNGRAVEGAMEIRHGDNLQFAVSQSAPEGAYSLVFETEAVREGLTRRIRRAVGRMLDSKKIASGRITFEEKGELIVARLKGVFRRRECDYFAGRIKAELSLRPRSVALDLREVRYMNSYALSVLVEIASLLEEENHALRVFGAQGTVYKLLTLPGQASPMQMYESEDEAFEGRTF
jgi:anti-anti-sigma factor